MDALKKINIAPKCKDQSETGIENLGIARDFLFVCRYSLLNMVINSTNNDKKSLLPYCGMVNIILIYHVAVGFEKYDLVYSNNSCC